MIYVKVKDELEIHIRKIAMLGWVLWKTHWNYIAMFEKGFWKSIFKL